MRPQPNALTLCLSKGFSGFPVHETHLKWLVAICPSVFVRLTKANGKARSCAGARREEGREEGFFNVRVRCAMDTLGCYWAGSLDFDLFGILGFLSMEPSKRQKLIFVNRNQAWLGLF